MKPYVDQIENYLSRYNNSEGTRDCVGADENNKAIADGDKVLFFSLLF